jgi:hypothetical protein
MATKKKAAAKRPAKKDRKAAPKALPAAVTVPAAAPKAAGRKTGLVLGALAVLLVAIGAQVFFLARHQAALDLNLVRVGTQIPYGMDQGQALSPQNLQGDKQDNLYFLEGMGGQAPGLLKFDPLNRFLVRYKPARPAEVLVDVADLAVSAQGAVYVLQKSGDIKVFDSELKFQRAFKVSVSAPTGMGIDSKDRLFISSMNDNKVQIFTATGAPAGEFGSPGSNTGDLASPVRLRVGADDLVVVLELLSDGLRLKSFTPDLKLKRQVKVKDIPWSEAMRMGLNADDIVILNDSATNKAVGFYDMRAGELRGYAKGTTDNILFLSPGSCGANEYSRSFFIHSVGGLTRALIPAPGK